MCRFITVISDDLESVNYECWCNTLFSDLFDVLKKNHGAILPCNAEVCV